MASAWAQRYGGAALVTGASSGIGLAFAEALAGRGMNMVLVARRAEALQALAQRLSAQHGVSAWPIACDVSAPEAADDIERQLKAQQIDVGLLVHSAGFGSFGAFAGLEPQAELGMVDVNCRAPLALTYTFLPQMLARGRGGVVFVSSLAAYQPTPYCATYGATKAFVSQLAEALWAELKPQGVDVLSLCPGYVRTGFQQAAHAQQMPVRGAVLGAAQVVDEGLRALGRKASHIPGRRNWLLSWVSRLMPRALAASLAMRFNAPVSK